MEAGADLVVSYGGSLSGEHGDGQSRAELLPKMFGPELMQAFREFKSIWDPAWKMNPGKVIEPYRFDENLRLGPDYHPWEPVTHFKFPEDHGSIASATMRCVGVGKCRHYEGGVMCPSFRATREEANSTRGRAHLLWEMTQQDVINDGWNSEAVKESLDLCLACKGCKSDCPVNVDVATYKAEFLSHYYEQHPRPLNVLALSHIDQLVRVGSQMPGLVNLATQLPILRDLAKLVAGVPAERQIPTFAPQTFKEWWEHRQGKCADGKCGDGRPRPSSRVGTGDPARPAKQSLTTVLLWADTFNNNFLPSTGQAAVEVLEAAGFTVKVPREHLCCGRPLYDIGMLDRAKSLYRQIMDTLEPEIAAGTPIVILEPSCAAVFRDEALNLFPDDPRALALSKQVFLLSEFLEKFAKDFPIPPLARKALVHGHCHHKAIMKMTDEEAVLRRMGVEFTSPAPGCCGMAGAFGFEKEKYPVSKAIGEMDLLPAVRQAPTDWLIVADGFSCREQIAQETDRHGLHLAEVLQMALHEARQEPSQSPTDEAINKNGETGAHARPTTDHVGTAAPGCPVERSSTLIVPEHYPEDAWVRPREAAVKKSMKRTGIALAGIAAAAALLWTLARKR
jgi:Fe-S oxidoreductase